MLAKYNNYITLISRQKK